MSSLNVSNKCTSTGECKKNGIIKCDGCFARFCSEHFAVHRRELDNILEVLCSERDLFHYELQHQSDEQSNEFLIEIDRWEEQTIEQVRRTANNARYQIRQLSRPKSSNKQFQLFSEELRSRKENEDFYENDLQRLQQQFQQIKIQANQRNNIDISYINIDWQNLIEITNKDDQPVSDHLFHQTSLLNRKQQEILNEFSGRINQKWELIYRGTRDGFKGEDFLSRCSEQGPTMTLILADQYLFGGYTTVNWINTTGKIWNEDPSAFLFTLINPHEIPPTKYPIQSSGYRAIRSCPQFGPTFGDFDICVHSDSHANDSSNIGFPTNYSDTTGKGEDTFTGSHQFQVSDIEVYKQI